MFSFEPPPCVSVIIVAWNNSEYLVKCLNCLVAQTTKNFEVIIVDNGSVDGAINGLEYRWSRLLLRVERLESNLGFAGANNIGARLARGKWLALLNADAFPEPDWLEQLVRAASENSEFTFFASRQIQANAPELLDGSGDAYHISGLAWREDYNLPVSNYGIQAREVFSACAAAALYLRSDFISIGGFDEDYFSYFEDVDLSFRLRLAGGRCLYVPGAVVYHVGSASTGKLSDFVIYYGHRNLVWAYFKNMPFVLFWLFLPLHILMNLYFLVSFGFKGKWVPIFKAKRDALYGIPSILCKRRFAQMTRSASTINIYQMMVKGIFSPFRASRRRRLTRK